MAKIMLVEDDTNLSEIYQARLTAEGYDIVSAHDGEEALALAAKEKPDLVISDVMMPKISGFEMLDILRNTEGLKETKVIMLTALGQADDKSRAESMGADRYLVKSQVTLEDIVKAAQELLSGDTGTPAAAPAASAPAEPAATVAAPVPTPVAPAPAPTPMAVAAPPEPQQPVASVPVAAAPQPQAPVATPMLAPAPVAPTPAMPAAPPPSVPVAVAPAPQAPAPAPTTIPTPAVPTNPVAAAPQPQPQAPVATPMPAPAPVAPTTSIDATTAADDQLVTSAVEDLEKAAQPAPAAQPTAPSQTPGSPTNDSAAPEPSTSPEPEASNPTDDNVGVAHKKVIRPIDSSDSPKPSLETLLADEERKNPGSTMGSNTIVTGNPQGQAATTPPPRVPHQPGHIISPDAAAASPNTGGGIDPNSIAL